MCETSVEGCKSQLLEIKESWNEIESKVNSTPTMVFSVIGDSNSFVPRPWAKTVFQTALIEAAKSGGDTWILYRGHDYGVSSIVRDAYRKYSDSEFGSQSSGKDISNLQRHVKLISIAGKRAIAPSDLTQWNCTIDPRDKEQFLLDFEEYISNQEVAFFSHSIDLKMPVPVAILACEGDISTIRHIAGALERKIPVIIIRGSGKAADLILDFLDDNDNLVLKASLLFGVRFNSESFNELQEYLTRIKDRKDLVAAFDVDRDDPLVLSNTVGESIVRCWAIDKTSSDRKTDENKVASITEHLENSRDDSEDSSQENYVATPSVVKVKILRRNSVSPEPTEVDRVLKCYKESRPYVLNPKYASPTSLPLYFYFGYQLLQEIRILDQCGHVLLFEALKSNRCDYVRVLLDHGVMFEFRNLLELYEQTVSCNGCNFEKDDCLHTQWILRQIEEEKAKIVCDHDKYRFFKREIQEKNEEIRLYTRIMNGEIHETKIYVNNQEIDLEKLTKKQRRRRLQKLINSMATSRNDTESSLNQLTEDNEDRVARAARGLCRKTLGYRVMHEKDKDISDILLWAIFANRKELAEICWLRTDDHLLTGLICSAILKKLSKKAYCVKEQNLGAEFNEHAKLFEERCLAIMDRLYEEDTQSAIDLMDDVSNVWGIKSSPLTFAHENFLYDVVAHACSQKHMNLEWYNNLAPDLKPFMKSMFRKPRKFFTAPVTKYMYNYITFLVMLIFYSFFVLTSIGDEYYQKNTIARVFEYFVYFWGFGDLVEELISCFGCLESVGKSHRGYYTRLKRYLYDFWNVVDLLSYLLLIMALFVRHLGSSSPNHTDARRMFSLSLLVMYLRFLEVFLVHRRLGPTLIMIKEMLKDLLNFLFLAVFIMIGVGIYYHANLWPDDQEIWSGKTLKKVMYYTYWQLYAEINLEILEGNASEKCTTVKSEWSNSNPSKERCPEDDWTVGVVLALYMLLSNLLLVNLVIAMFSYTFERVHENSEKLWRFHRYTVINDYVWRIPSPINLILLPKRFCCPGGGRKNRCKAVCCNKEKVEKESKDHKKEKKYRRNLQRNVAFAIYNKL
ncbi:uncharacterized protein LOC125651630 [Ostrea edulis]|uniref:uncharacterized protein LOC125651630 n=1 Tax=Ostrea edulis TaxID=37623 RepID=UPI0024AF0D64|nr:uncharacterized protein LOC125651630 [Ostrea edulis]